MAGEEVGRIEGVVGVFVLAGLLGLLGLRECVRLVGLFGSVVLPRITDALASCIQFRVLHLNLLKLFCI